MEYNSKGNPQPIYFDPVKVGASMIEVGVDYQEIESREVETRWFRDALSETDVFVWSNKDKKMIKQQVCVMGMVVEWNILEGVKTGVILESELNMGDIKMNGLTTGDATSESIHFDNKVQERTLNTAISILKNMKCVEVDLKNNMMNNLNQGFSFQLFPKKTSVMSPQSGGGLKNLLFRLKNFFLSCFNR